MTTTETHIRLGALTRRFLLLVLPALVGGLCASTATGIPIAHSSANGTHAQAAAYSFGYPVKPFHREHPVRGFLGDPRMIISGPPTRRALMTAGVSASFHQGVDIVAPDGTAVYPVESGQVVGVRGLEVSVGSDDGSRFEYWHIRPSVAVGARVEAYATVLGHIVRPCMHVHLTEYEQGRVVNPLAPGHLGPYTDTTRPRVAAIRFLSATDGSEVLPGFVRGRVQLVADAFDLPTKPVPGEWANLPTTPALLTWTIRRWPHKVVVPRRAAYDFRSGIPANGSFWNVYARGTYQNMAVFGKHYSYLQPGDFLFRLGPGPLDTRTLRDGVYELTVTATDVRGNAGSLTRRFTIHNRPGWAG
jgi:hypothetical protein